MFHPTVDKNNLRTRATLLDRLGFKRKRWVDACTVLVEKYDGRRHFSWYYFKWMEKSTCSAKKLKWHKRVGNLSQDLPLAGKRLNPVAVEDSSSKINNFRPDFAHVERKGDMTSSVESIHHFALDDILAILSSKSGPSIMLVQHVLD